MTIYLKSIIVFFSLLFFTSGINPLFSQRTKNWSNYKDYSSYREGTFSREVSAPPIELISLYSYFEKYEFDKNQKLTIEFCTPTDLYFFLKLEEKNITKYYRLESKSGNIKGCKQNFPPISVDQLLKRLGILKTNLAVLLRVKMDDSNYALPVSVYHSLQPTGNENYEAIFRLGKPISGGTFRVCLEEQTGTLPANKLVQKTTIGRYAAGNTPKIVIEKEKLSHYKGWVTVDLLLLVQDSYNKIPFRFYFYHAG